MILLATMCVSTVMSIAIATVFPQGVTISVKSKELRLCGALLAFVGDTPAANKVGGFKEGVSMAERKCRQCMTTNHQMQTKVCFIFNFIVLIIVVSCILCQFYEEDFVARDKESHEKQCDRIEGPGITQEEKQHYSKVYGVNRRSILCELTSFDITKNIPQDMMHILLEGAFPLHLKLLMENAPRPVTLGNINRKLKEFPFAYFQERPKALTSTDLTGSQTGIDINNRKLT